MSMTMSLTRWFKTVDSSNAVAAAAVPAVEKEDIEMKKQGRKRRSSEQHHFDEKLELRLESLLLFM